MRAVVTIAHWDAHAHDALRAAGFRSGGARRRIVELLARENCALSALEIDRRLDGVGRASVYRILDQLEQLGLVQRVDLGADAAGYERVDPHGEHHHHIVCGSCGRVAPFSDRRLEQAIQAIGERSSFEVSTHEVILRGTCDRCGRSR